MAKDKIVYQEKYKKGALMLKPDSFPDLRHIPENFEVANVDIRSAGKCEVGDETLEFQDVRIYFRDKENGKEIRS